MLNKDLVKKAMTVLSKAREQEKRAFQPMDSQGMPPQAPPPGMPPGPPQGAPSTDPSMGGAPMDPSMGGAPQMPGDPAAGNQVVQLQLPDLLQLMMMVTGGQGGGAGMPPPAPGMPSPEGAPPMPGMPSAPGMPGESKGKAGKANIEGKIDELRMDVHKLISFFTGVQAATEPDPAMGGAQGMPPGAPGAPPDIGLSMGSGADASMVPPVPMAGEGSPPMPAPTEIPPVQGMQVQAQDNSRMLTLSKMVNNLLSRK